MNHHEVQTFGFTINFHRLHHIYIYARLKDICLLYIKLPITDDKLKLLFHEVIQNKQKTNKKQLLLVCM